MATDPFHRANRRRWLQAGAGAVALATSWSRLALAAPAAREGGPRFVFVVLRGGMDGLSAVPAPGDPAFAAARGVLAEAGEPLLRLDDTHALHPRLAGLHAMVREGDAAVLHAIGLTYHDRSHFDGQQVLESGGTRPHELATGWLARALAAAPGAASAEAQGLALSTAVPLVLRGPAAVDTWAPSALPDPDADLVARLARLYDADPPLATALDRARRLHQDPMAASDALDPSARGFPVLARRAADFLAAPAGPQAAVLELYGWDTHGNQANPRGPLASLLGQLDAGLVALKNGLLRSGAWGRTVVVVATEFGRQVAINGTLGTDHGSGGAAFLLGGAVNGGRVIADWPGLGPRDRFEGRDLRTTTDLRALLKTVLADHLKVASRRLDREVFPGAGALRPLDVLRA